METTKTVYVARRAVRYMPSGQPGSTVQVEDLGPGTILPDDFDPDTLRHLVETGCVDAYDVPLSTPGEQA